MLPTGCSNYSIVAGQTESAVIAVNRLNWTTYEMP